MRLFVVGATGGTGRALVQQALTRLHRVTAFVRAPEKLGVPREGLTVVQGDVLDSGALAAALGGHDAVVSTVGQPGTARSTITSDSARAIVAAMRTARVRRLLVTSVAVLFADAGILAAFLRTTFLRNVAEDSAAMERAVEASDLDWTIVRPPRLTNGPLTSRHDCAVGRLPPGAGANASVSRADLAHFLLDEVEHSAHLRQVVGVAYTRHAPATLRDGASIQQGASK
jgi:putative NADH-flavin reductase